MGNKQNPVLAAFEAKLRREFEEEKRLLVAQLEENFQARLACNSEINMIAMLIGGDRLKFLGEKRADQLIEEQIDVKMEIAQILLKDSEDDPSLEHTRVDLARTIRQILGPEGWEKHKKLFPICCENLE